MSVLLAGVVAVAQAQIDTELTPVAKAPSPTQWTNLGGAKFDRGGQLFNGADSPTPFTVDFFSTAFLADDPATELDDPVGLFGGAECRDPGTPFDDVADCERRPVVYRYRKDDLGQEQLERMPLVDGDDPAERGYVAAVAWIGRGRALAVGGDRVYPRREPPAQSGDAAYAEYDREQWAGRARAWLYEDAGGDGAGEWRELELPDEMRALTALDCAQSTLADGIFIKIRRGTCFAGGLQQVWRWHVADDNRPGDPVAEGFDSHPVLSAESGFHFRVRQLRVLRSDNDKGMPRVFAVTSGCCAPPEAAAGGGRALSSDNGLAWRVEPFGKVADKDASLGAEDTSSSSGALADSYYGFVAARGNRKGGYAGLASAMSAIASPGGDAASEGVEPGSRIVARIAGAKTNAWGTPDDYLSRALEGVRLLAADGDFQTTEQPTRSLGGSLTLISNTGGDGMLDWAVGRFKDSEQGVAFTTVPSWVALPSPFTCRPLEGDEPWAPILAGGAPACDLETSNVTDADTGSRRLLAMGTYALNALSFVGDDGAQAWAAGDRGALLRFGSDAAIGGDREPLAPALIAGNRTPLSKREPFERFEAAAAGSRPGVVPALTDQPLERLPRKTLVPWGTADASLLFHGRRTENVTALAMSRDGSEGWAVGTIGGGHPQIALQHFDGERWVRCDVDGLGGVYEPDEACASLQPLLKDDNPNNTARVLMAIARIPLERDGDSSNDDEFEALAIGRNVVLRYRDGRWRHDVEASSVVGTFGSSPTVSIAFARPDEGWVVSTNGGQEAKLYRYIGGEGPGHRWFACSNTPVPSECGDVSLFFGGANAGITKELQVAGETIFAMGTRSSSPFVLSKRPGEPWRQEYDPACPQPTPQGTCADQPPVDPSARGLPSSLSVVDLGDKGIAGWLLGQFGRNSSLLGIYADEYTRSLGPEYVLVRRDPATGRWAPRRVDDAAQDMIPIAPRSESTLGRLVSVRDRGDRERSFIFPPQYGDGVSHPPIEYDPERDRWGVLPAPFVSSTNGLGTVEMGTQGHIQAAGPDNQGGIWVVAESLGGWSIDPHDAAKRVPQFYYRYSDVRHREVFEDVASPVAEPITGLAGTPYGELWVSTESDRLYHYNRIAGWERARVKGWDRGRVVTRPSRTLAVAVNDNGMGIAVGEGGRIANLRPDGVALDPASARRCSDGPPPCGTPRNLRAAAVAPDGAAMAGGEELALVWRPAGGEFRTIERPRMTTAARVRAISLPDATHAWLTVSSGRDAEIWAGTLVDGRWRWSREADSEAARDEGFDGREPFARLFAIEVQADGRGLAVGHRGAMLERSTDGSWRRLKSGHVDDLYAIAFPPSGYGDGTLVAGGTGTILTRSDGRYRVARRGDFTDPLTTGGGRIVGLALARGTRDGEVEAWAASQVDGHRPRRVPAPFALLHYASDGNRLLDTGSRVRPLPDAPAAEPGELTLAAFGRSECQLNDGCPPFLGANLFNEIVSRRIHAELVERRRESGGAFAALFTGDVNVAPGRDEEKQPTLSYVYRTHTPVSTNVAHDQWRELAARPLVEAGVPVFAAIGKRDLSRVRVPACGGCEDSQDVADAGLSVQWRRAFAGMPGPWGDGSKLPSPDTGDVEFVPVERRSSLAVEAPEGGARTHYAVDVKRAGEPLARLVFVDNTFARSLSASEGSQNPVEGRGGQAGWVERMLCVKGTPSALGKCTREPGQHAVVVTNAPTYSYGPGGLDAVQADGSALESLLVRHGATAVVSGRLGWNGLFYTLAPGVHAPCPGGGYPAAPPSPEQGPCGQTAGADELPKAPAGAELAQALRGLGAPLPAQADDAVGAVEGARRPIPNLVASTAGGRFGPTGGDDGQGSQGFWHGYSVMRVRRDGEVIVEQRPILDWIGIEASEHTLLPGQKLTLRGFGREPYGTDTSFRMYRIDSPAITHRYDLVEANPDSPALPREDANGEYVPLDPRVATVDAQTGLVRAGKGRQQRTYAIGVLSIGDRAASWPLVFEPAKSFKPRPATTATIAPPARPLSQPLQPPTIQVLSQPPTQAPPAAPPASPIATPTANLELPPPPSLPPIGAGPATASPAPPPLPAPPAPPSTGEALPLTLEAPITPVSIVPTVIPPTPPPINPAPPGGSAARKEARQRQAATAKSEEGADSAREQGIDTGEGPASPHGAAMTRYDRRRPQAGSFTMLARAEQPSAWSRGALYGSGLTLMALTLALGWAGGRPDPRRRPPVVPAPGQARVGRR